MLPLWEDVLQNLPDERSPAGWGRATPSSSG
jgi:hypothetical protein